MNNKTINSKVYSVVFVALFFLILIAQLFVPDFDVKTISGNYLWRKNFISGYNTFKYEIGDRLFSIAVIGKDGGFYFTGDKSIPDYQKTDPINVSKMKRLTQLLVQLKKKTNENGGVFLLVIPPNKSTIYPQNMPDEIPVLGEISSLDRLLSYIDENSDVQTLDLRPALTQASIREKIYYQTDTHWNCHGAFYAYKEILIKLQTSYPEIISQLLSDFDIVPSENVKFDIISSLGINITESSQYLSPKFQTDFSVKKTPSLLILHDSFYNACLDKFMETAFEDINAMPYNSAVVKDYIQLIEDEKPEIVIVEFVERFMEYFYWHLID